MVSPHVRRDVSENGCLDEGALAVGPLTTGLYGCPFRDGVLELRHEALHRLL